MRDAVRKLKAYREAVPRVARILRAWDPLKLLERDTQALARYDGYASYLARQIVLIGCSERELAYHLRLMRTRMLGLRPNPSEERLMARLFMRHIRGV